MTAFRIQWALAVTACAGIRGCGIDIRAVRGETDVGFVASLG